MKKLFKAKTTANFFALGKIIMLVLFLNSFNGNAQISFTGTTYTQNFNTLAASGTNNLWTNGSTLEGWYLFRQPAPGTAITTYNADAGTGTTGNFISYGSASIPERALGGLGSGGVYFGSPAGGAIAGWIAVAFANNSGLTINDITVSFNGEQWRNNNNATPQTMVLEYGFGASFETVSSWTAPGANFDWTSIVNTTTAAAVDGNAAGLVPNKGGTLNSLNWTNGTLLWIRWVERNDAGNDHGIAIDDFSLSTSVTPATPIVTISATDANAAEAGTNPGTFRIGRTGATTDPLTVSYTISGTAEGTDYTPTLTGTATILATQSFVDITITPDDDAFNEGDETVILTLVDGMDYDLGGLTNATVTIADNDVPVTITKIHTIQGNAANQLPNISGSGAHNDRSPLEGQTVTIQGIVTAVYNDLNAFFIQEEDADADADPSTSEGIFVFTGVDPTVSEGNQVTVTGAVDEFFGMTQIDNDNGNFSVTINSSGNPLPSFAVIDLPIAAAQDIDDFYERSEAMRVRFQDKMVVSEYFAIGRYGQITLTENSRPFQYTHLNNTPSSAGYTAFTNDLARRTIIVDDENNIQNAPLGFAAPNNVFFHPRPGGLSTGVQGTNFFRGGDAVNNLTGVLHWSFAGFTGTDAWRIRPTQATPVQFTVENIRPAAPANVGGNIKVASFNVLNYFTTIDNGGINAGPTGNLQEGRGADSQDELTRQTQKLVQALKGINADVFGLVELENNSGNAGANGGAIKAVVDALNAEVGAGTYGFINTGNVGTDAITVGIIYKTAVVSPVGTTGILNSTAFTDPNNTGLQRSRPAIASTFQVTNIGNPDFGAKFTVVVNHFKSKGAGGETGLDADQGDGQGNWNDTRAKAALALAAWLATDPTGSNDPDFLIMGDLNAYKGENPITNLKNAGFNDLIETFGGSNAYSYVFDGQLGYLDHALANAALTAQVTGATDWHINADEINVFDYNNSADDGAGEQDFEAEPAGNNLFEVNAYRTSDHDPVIVGLDLTAPPAIRITEYMYNGLGAGDAGEYVEFTNVGNTPVDMTGWSFDDNSRTAGSVILSGFGIVQPGESVILTELTASAFRTNWGLCNGVKVVGSNTNNLGRSDEINLYDGSGILVDRLTYNDQALGGPRTNGASGWVSAAGLGANIHAQWTRSLAGDAESSFLSIVSEIGSPGKSTRAVVVFNPCPPGAMRITEYMYNGLGTGDVGEYVEFTNVGTTPVDMSGYSYDDNSRTAGSVSLTGFGIVQPGESVILTELSVSAFRLNWGLCNGVKIIGGNTNNLGRSDEINLYDASNALADRLTYNDQALGGPRTNGASAWVSAAGLGANIHAQWTRSLVGDAESSYASSVAEIGSPGKSTRTISSFDPCPIIVGAPTIIVNVTATTNFLDGGSATSPATPFAVSGVISDPTDPAKFQGVDFTIGDDVTPVGSLTVTVASSNTSVVPAGNLILSGTGDSRNLKITPAAVGRSNITVTVNDGVFNTSYILNYAASAASVNSATTRFHTGTSDASTAQAIDENYMLVADDENQVLRLYDRQNSGLPLTGTDVTSSLAFTDAGHPEADIESSVKVGNRIYWLTSHGNSSGGEIRVNRYRLFATDLSGSGSATTLSYVGRYDGLRTDLVNWDASNAHGLGANYFGFTASVAQGIIPEQPDGSGFNIEGLTIAPDNTTAYICFRAPISPANNRTKALIVPVTNFTSLVSGNPSAGPATFGVPIQLDLGGRGIREIKRNASGQYLIAAGAHDGADNFRLYTWTGNPADAPVLTTADLTALNANGSFESIVDLPDPLTSSSPIQLLVDNGDAVFYNDGIIAKEQAENNHKKFRSEIITLGCIAPFVTGQPLSAQTVCQNSTPVSLIATVTGDGLSYQWYSNTTNSNTGGAPLNGETNNSFTPPALTTGTFYYYVVVTGTCGTATSDAATVIVDAIPVITSAQTNPSCFGASNGAIDITVTGGTAPFTYAWTGNGVNPVAEDQTGLTAGKYIVVVTDAGSCSASSTVTLTQPAQLDLAETHTAILCFGGTSTITISATGGTAPYTGTGTFTQSAGTQSYTVTDANGCSSSVSVTATQPAQLTITASAPPILCFGGSTIVTLVASGGTAPYTYSSGTPTPTRFAGTYTYVVTDANGCTASTVLTITQPAQLVVSASTTPVACFGGTSTVTISATGGTAPYTGTGTFTQSAGTQSYTVTDANGCTSSVPVTVTQPTQLTASATSTPVSTIGGADGTATVTASGGTPPYTYLWSPGGQTTATANGLPAGTYTATVTDANGCTATATTTVGSPDCNITLSFTQNNVLCFSGSTGTATVTAANTTGTVIYLWSNGQTTATAAGLASGTYSVTVTDGAGCTATGSIIITQPASAIIASSTASIIACNGGSATITVSATGGTSPYTGTGTFSRTAGTYTFTVTDANGCTAVTSVTISEPTALIATTTSTAATSGSNGTATANPTGGTAPYTYLWAQGGQTTQTATGLGAGTYTVTVTDSKGCTTTATATVVSNGCILAVNAGPDKAICNNASNVTLAASVTGVSTGTAPATPFTELPTTTTDMKLFSGKIDYIAIGNTFSKSEDRNNCGQNATSAKTLTIPAGAIVKKAYLYWSGSGSLDDKVKLNGTSVTADGTKTYNVSGVGSFFGARKDVTSMVTASGTYTVSELTWSNSSSYCQWNGAYGAWGMVVVYELSSLPSARIHLNTEKFQMTYPTGNYSTTIPGISVPSGCSSNAKFTIIAFEGDNYKGEGLIIGGQSFGDNNFRGQSGPNLDILSWNIPTLVTSNTSSLTYTINAYQSNTVFGLATEALFDYVKVLKYNNCPANTCNVAYQWKKNGTTVGTTQSISVSTAGTYEVTATDCAGCIATDQVVVTASTLSASATAGIINCYGGATNVTVTATGGTAPYTGTGTFSKTAGTYSFTVTDAAGCTKVTSVTITQPTQLAVIATAPVIPCGGTTTIVTVSATGGTAPYTGTGTFTKGPGTWTFTVTDAKGCTASKTVVIANAIACGPVDPGKCYKLTARHSGKALTIENGSASNGADAEQRSYSGDNSQKWKFVQVQTGYYEIINVNSNKALEVTGGSSSNGAVIQQNAYSGADYQKWSLNASGTYYVVKAKHSGKSITVEDASNSNGADVEQRSGSSNHQQWTISEVGCPVMTRGIEPIITKGEILPSELEVTVLPNPSATNFILNVKSNDKESAITVRVMDASGKMISVHPKVGLNTALRIGGEKWAGGIYFAEVTQGGQRKVVKMIKVN